MKRFLVLIFALFILLPVTSQAQQVTDANLQNCIAAAAGRPFESLSDKDLLDITSLGCQKRDIASIDGIENLTNLVELNLNGNRINDISPLAVLSNLSKLYLWNNYITDTSPLAGLKGLKELHLEGNLVEDLKPLAKLRNVEELLLGSNQINDITPLIGLEQLFWLELFNNQLIDISPLAKLARLEYLDISKNKISDIGALKELKKLERLYLNENSINDINPLAGLKSVRNLFLGYNRISDISPVAKLTELQIIDLSANSIGDIPALRNLVNLRRLTLDNNLVGNINPLIGLPNLAHVSLFNNCINTIGSFAQSGIIVGMEYQHNLCSSPNLVKKIVTQKWLDEQTRKQCIDYDGENDYSLKGDYEYYPDGIYYNYFIRDTKGTVVRKTACRLPWNSNINDFIMNLEKVDRDEDSFEVLQYRKNHIYVNDGRVKGYSVNNQSRVGGEYSILSDIAELFRVRYSLEKIRPGSYDVLVGKGEGHVIRIVETGEKYSLQFFEPDFYTEEISKGQ